MRKYTHSVLVKVTLTCVVGLVGAISIGPTQLPAQELRSAVNDFRNERVFDYQPSDPFVRSKLWQVQTKHYGLFYNCDNEECKRNSPYICWKTHHEKDFPTLMTIQQRIRHEANQVRQRILDGAGMCAAGCQCQQCQANPGGCANGQCGEGSYQELAPMPANGAADDAYFLSRRQMTDPRNQPARRVSPVATNRSSPAQRRVVPEPFAHQANRLPANRLPSNRNRAPQAKTEVAAASGLLSVNRPGQSPSTQQLASRHERTQMNRQQPSHLRRRHAATPIRSADLRAATPERSSMLEQLRKLQNKNR